MVPRETSYFCFPSSPDVSLDFVSETSELSEKQNCFPRDDTLRWQKTVSSTFQDLEFEGSL